MYYGHNTYTMATGNVLFFVWLSSLVMQVGGSGGRSPPGKQGGFGGGAGPPNGGPSLQRGGMRGGGRRNSFEGHPMGMTSSRRNFWRNFWGGDHVFRWLKEG